MELESSLPHSEVPANCPCPEPARSNPHPHTPHHTSWWSILILSSHLRLGIPSGLFHSGFPIKTLYTYLPSLIRATCPAHFILLDFITRTIFGETYRSLSFSLCSFLHSLVTSSLLGPNILLNILFSNTLSLRSSLTQCLIAVQILSLSFVFHIFSFIRFISSYLYHLSKREVMKGLIQIENDA